MMNKSAFLFFLYLWLSTSCRPQLHELYKHSIEDFDVKSSITLELDTTGSQFNLYTRHSNDMVGDRDCFGTFYRNGNKIFLVPYVGTYIIDTIPNSNEYTFIVIDGITADTLDFFHIRGESFALDTIASKGFSLSAQFKGDVLVFPTGLFTWDPTNILRVELNEFGRYAIIKYEWFIGQHLLEWDIRNEKLISDSKSITLYSRRLPPKSR